MLRTDCTRARRAPRASSRSLSQCAAPAAAFEPLERRTFFSLAAAGEPFRVNDPSDVFDFFPTVAMDADGDSVVSWFHINEDFSDGWPVARMYDAQGNPKGPEFQVNTQAYAQNEPHVDMNDDGSFQIAYLGNSLFVRSYGPDGTPHGPEFAVDGGLPGHAAGGGFPYVDIASEGDGGFVIAWKQTFDDGTGAIYARRYDAGDQPVGAAYRVDEPAGQTGAMDVQVAVNDKNEVMVAWRQRPNFGTAGDLYARVFSNVDVPFGPEFVIDAGGEHSVPAVSGAKKDFVVAWRDTGGVAGGPQEIRAQRFDRHGRALGTPVLVEGDVPASQSISTTPSIEAATDGRFAVAWAVAGAQPRDPGTAYIRQFNAAGQPESDPVRLGTGAQSGDLGGFAADDNLAHGLLVWGTPDSFIAGQFVSDPGATASSAVTSGGDSAATDLLYV
jgi:hypothetical protein